MLQLMQTLFNFKRIRIIGTGLVVMIVAVGAFALHTSAPISWLSHVTIAPRPAEAASIITAATVWPSFRYTFSSDGTLDEVGTMADSHSQYWWLSSGAQMVIKDGVGMTLHGAQSAGSPQQIRYATYDNDESGGGYYPQNIFRLVTRSQWQNYTQQVQFKIDRINMTNSKNRQAANGIFFFNRYQDQDTLYYTGIRVDGTAVIKKKYQGTYTTLAQKRFFSTGELSYNTNTNPNLMPGDRWMGMRSVVTNQSDGSVKISLYVDPDNTGNWQLAATPVDSGQDGHPPITKSGYAGIRTDFMDASFDNYYIVE